MVKEVASSCCSTSDLKINLLRTQAHCTWVFAQYLDLVSFSCIFIFGRNSLKKHCMYAFLEEKTLMQGPYCNHHHLSPDALSNENEVVLQHIIGGNRTKAVDRGAKLSKMISSSALHQTSTVPVPDTRTTHKNA